VFQIDFYNYDRGDLDATYDLQLWAPTGSGEAADGTVFIDEDENGGGRDLDASVTLDVRDELAASGEEPHAQQGYHLRVTVHAEGSIGADVKHKMLWTSCAVTSPSPSPNVSPSEIVSPSLGVSPSDTTSPTTEVLGGGGSSPTATTAVLGAMGTSPSAAVLAVTGPNDDLPWLVGIGAALLLVGTLALRIASRRGGAQNADWLG